MSVYFKETGNKSAKTIVFIHGGGISGWMWDKELDYFKNYHCIVPDLPEHGKSTNEGQISIMESSKIIADIIRKHTYDGKAHVVGHSLGAKIIVNLLSTSPEVVDHAVIASALFRPIPLMKLTHKKFIYDLTVSLLKAEWVLNLQVKMFKFPDKISSDNLKRDFKSMTSGSLYRTYDELYKSLTLPENLNKTDVPALIIAGEKEPKAMKESVKDMVNLLPKSKGIYIRNGLHTYPWVMQDIFNHLIDAWINDRNIDNNNILEL